MKKVIIYISKLNKIGGVETFVYNFCKRMNPFFDITLLYSDCLSDDFLYKISDFVNCKKFIGQNLECNTLLLASAWGINPEDKIKAEKYIQMIHADYLACLKDWHFKYKKGNKTTHHVAVGDHVAKQFEKATPFKIDAVINNLLDNNVKIIPKKESKTLRLVTISRLSKEKGFERMLKMESLLKDFDYIWDVYGDEKTNYGNLIVPKFKKMQFKGITKEPQKIIQSYDFLVQLSDTEGFPYSVYEALQVNVPVISTDYPSVHELIEDDKNGYIFNMDLSNFVIPKKLTINGFKEKSNEQNWIEIL